MQTNVKKKKNKNINLPTIYLQKNSFPGKPQFCFIWKIIKMTVCRECGLDLDLGLAQLIPPSPACPYCLSVARHLIWHCTADTILVVNALRHLRLTQWLTRCCCEVRSQSPDFLPARFSASEPYSSPAVAALPPLCAAALHSLLLPAELSLASPPAKVAPGHPGNLNCPPTHRFLTAC